MTGGFEVSATADVRAACPVCDPVANIYGPVQDGSRPSLLPFLPVLSSKSEVWVGGQCPSWGGCPGSGGLIYGAQDLGAGEPGQSPDASPRHSCCPKTGSGCRR